MTMNRAQRPYPPTMVTFNGTPFPTTINNSAPVAVAWRRRDRLNASIRFPSDADEAPEAGTEYWVGHEGVEELLGPATSGSFRFKSDGTKEVRIFAKRDGLKSNELILTVTVTGSPAAPGAAPDAPATVTASPLVVSNGLSWPASGGEPATGYTIYGLVGAGSFADAVALGSTPALTFVHRGAQAGVAWRYWVVGYNASGTSPASPEATSTAYADTTAGEDTSGVGDPGLPGSEGDTYTDVSQEPPVKWVYVGGQWMRQNTYDVVFTWPSQVPSLRTFLRFGVVRDFVLPVGLTGSQFSVDDAPTQPVTLTLRKNGVDIGTITWAASQKEGTAAFTAAVTFTQDDDLELYAPMDLWGMKGLFITLAGSR